MTTRDFCYWLQGYIEVGDAGGQVSNLTVKQVETIRRHLAMVFAHDIDPKAGGPAEQKKLNDIHNPFHLGTGSVTVSDPGNVIVRC